VIVEAGENVLQVHGILRVNVTHSGRVQLLDCHVTPWPAVNNARTMWQRNHQRCIPPVSRIALQYWTLYDVPTLQTSELLTLAEVQLLIVTIQYNDTIDDV